jgi:hypothetical protein
MQEIKKIGILSVGKIGLFFGIVLGLVLGLVAALVSNYASSTLTAQAGLGAYGWWSLIIFPVLYGILYFIGGVIGAALYNLFASWVGGVKIEFKK